MFWCFKLLFILIMMDGLLGYKTYKRSRDGYYGQRFRKPTKNLHHVYKPHLKWHFPPMVPSPMFHMPHVPFPQAKFSSSYAPRILTLEEWNQHVKLKSMNKHNYLDTHKLPVPHVYQYRHFDSFSYPFRNKGLHYYPSGVSRNYFTGETNGLFVPGTEWKSGAFNIRKTPDSLKSAGIKVPPYIFHGISDKINHNDVTSKSKLPFDAKTTGDGLSKNGLPNIIVIKAKTSKTDKPDGILPVGLRQSEITGHGNVADIQRNLGGISKPSIPDVVTNGGSAHFATNGELLKPGISDVNIVAGPRKDQVDTVIPNSGTDSAVVKQNGKVIGLVGIDGGKDIFNSDKHILNPNWQMTHSGDMAGPKTNIDIVMIKVPGKHNNGQGLLHEHGKSVSSVGLTGSNKGFPISIDLFNNAFDRGILEGNRHKGVVVPPGALFRHIGKFDGGESFKYPFKDGITSSVNDIDNVMSIKTNSDVSEAITENIVSLKAPVRVGGIHYRGVNSKFVSDNIQVLAEVGDSGTENLVSGASSENPFSEPMEEMGAFGPGPYYTCHPPSRVICGAKSDWYHVTGMEAWCQQNCVVDNYSSYCDDDRCSCECVTS